MGSLEPRFVVEVYLTKNSTAYPNMVLSTSSIRMNASSKLERSSKPVSSVKSVKSGSKGAEKRYFASFPKQLRPQKVDKRRSKLKLK